MCLGLFFRGWLVKERADPFIFLSRSVATVVEKGGGFWVGTLRAKELKREEKDLPSSYKVPCSAMIPFLLPHSVASISIAATLNALTSHVSYLKGRLSHWL